MTEESVLSGEIAQRLELAGNDFATFFAKLRNDFTGPELTEIYSDLLLDINNEKLEKGAKFLSMLIKEIDKLGDLKNLDGLIDFILDPSLVENYGEGEAVNLRVQCIKTISGFRNPKAVEPLLYCLNNKGEHYRCRLAAAEALGKIGDKVAVDSLINVVSDEEEKSVYVRESAAVALGLLGDSRAVDPFLGILEAKKSFLDKFTFLKERVLEALGKISSSNDQRVLNVLKNALADSSAHIRMNAIESLMNSNPPEAVELISDMIYDENEEVARSAVIALYNIEGREQLDIILANDTAPYYCKEEAKNIIDEYEDE